MLIAMAVWDTEENGRTWMTRATMASLAETVDWSKHRLIVVDNGSCAETQDMLDWWTSAGCFPFSRLEFKENLGTAAAINWAWRHRNPGEHAVKMDNDVTFYQAGWADWMEDAFDRDPTIGICGLKRKDLLECPWSDNDAFKSEIRMLPHEPGQRWVVIEEVRHVIGTCQGYSSALLDKIGYLVQPALYGFDDSLSAIRATVAGFKSAFLCGFEIEHLDPGGGAYGQWKQDQVAAHFPDYDDAVAFYKIGARDVYYDGL